MNRIIKFRAWDGSSMVLPEKNVASISFDGMVFQQAEGGEYPAQDWILMQFTGLKDKNGKEIYEGDILKVDWKDERYPVHNIGPIKWEEENAAWSLGEGGSPKHDAKYYFEVIGNIYESPELLK